MPFPFGKNLMSLILSYEAYGGDTQTCGRAKIRPRVSTLTVRIPRFFLQKIDRVTSDSRDTTMRPSQAACKSSDFAEAARTDQVMNEKKSHTNTYDSPPDGGLCAWLVVFACFLLSFNFLGLTYAFGVYQAHYIIHVFPHESPERISLIGSLCTALTLSSGIPAGRAIELFGYRKVALVGSAVFVGSLVAAGFCTTLPALIVTQGMCSGIGAGALFIIATAAPTQWFLKRRSLAMGIASAGSGVGGIFWSFVIRTLIAKLGYQWALWLSACICACIYAVACCLLKTRPIPLDSRHTSIWSSLVMFKDPKFITLYLASGISVFGYMVPYFYVPTYAQLQLGSSPGVGSILSAVLDLGLTIGRVVLGHLADSPFGTMNTVISGMALSGLCQFAFWLPAARSLTLLYVFSFSYGFLGGGYIGLLPAILVKIFDPEKLPLITGLFFTSELAGQMAGGPLAGAIFTVTHGQWMPMILYSGLTLFCGSLFAVATRFQVERRVFVTV